MPLKRGALIVLEGCDRSGKSTQSANLIRMLSQLGHKVQEMHFPDRSLQSGKLIDQYLLGKCSLEDHAIHLLFGSNRWELVPSMLQQLKSGTTIIVDRYAYSGVAFSAAKEGLSLEWCQQCDVGLPKPDLVFYLDLSPEEAQKRKGYGDEVYEKVSFQARVRENYLQLRKQENTWKVMDGAIPAEELSIKMKEICLKTIQNVPDKIGKLWTSPEETYP